MAIIDQDQLVFWAGSYASSEHRAMLDPVLPTSVVRIEFRPYSYGEVRDLLHRMARDFGLPGGNRRWRFETASTPDTQGNAWIIDFLFHDANDAIMFSLKHQR